jgi:glyoxylase-like metal-dependent hydrolase (beta-lactamase superfamily II)
MLIILKKNKIMNSVIPISIWSRGMINCFLIKGTEKHILVDTGVPNSENKIIAQLNKQGVNKKDIGLIIVTHAHIDHFGSAYKLKQLLQVPILAHQLDVESYITGKADISTMKLNKPQWWLFKQIIKNQSTEPFQPDILINGDVEYNLKEWGTNGKIIHTPGHTPGSLSIILENGEAIIMDMMASGILLGGVMFHERIKHPPFHDNIIELKNSFEKVLSLKAEVFYLGHGGPVNKSQIIRYYNKYLKNISNTSYV